jgi:GNAT superfamily N-acetyltransferase
MSYNMPPGRKLPVAPDGTRSDHDATAGGAACFGFRHRPHVFQRREPVKAMNDDYRIEYAERPEYAAIGGGLNQFNIEQAGDDQFKPICFVIRGPEEEVVGGIIGATLYDWLHIELLWVKDALRRNGYGDRLLKLAEDEARSRGAKNAFLDTLSFQAPDFYQKRGYEVFGELADFPKGHKRLYLQKQL